MTRNRKLALENQLGAARERRDALQGTTPRQMWIEELDNH
jgi:hypothetical protein